MRRLDRWLFVVLIVAALLAGVNTLAAAGGWLTAWRAFDDFGISLTRVTVSQDQSAIDVGLRLSNGSPSRIEIVQVTVALGLDGRTFSGGQQSPSSLAIPPGGRQEMIITNPVYGIDRQFLASHLERASYEWEVQGRVLVRVAGVPGTTWVPYAGRMAGP